MYHDIVKNVHADSKYEYVSLDELCAQSDILICMCSLTKETEGKLFNIHLLQKIIHRMLKSKIKYLKGYFNMKVFQKMKKNAVFINVSRGPVVNQTDLALALKNNVIAAAGLDVTVPEPLPKENELYSLKNCYITPHIASADTILRTKMFNITFQNILNGLNGVPLVSEIKHTE